MTTIFSKEIERLEKGCRNKITHYPKIETYFFSGNITNIYICKENNLCPTCKARIETLKQAEQKHLKFVEELKKRLRYNLVEKVDFITLSETAFKRDVEQEIDNLSKGDELK